MKTSIFQSALAVTPIGKRHKKQTRAMISVSLLRERENLRSSTQVRDTLYLATTKAGLKGESMEPTRPSFLKAKASLASKRLL